jgi:CRP/FNR family cyclic AMP-dependent transcriptional regulator
MRQRSSSETGLLRRGAVRSSRPAYDWLRELEPSARDRVWKLSVVRRFADREIVFEAGQPCDGLHVVRDGLVACGATSPEGKEFIHFLLLPGATFGAPSAIDRRPHFLSTWAEGEAAIAHLPQRALDQLLVDLPDLAMLLARQVCQEYRFAYAALEGHIMADLPVRMARMLVFSARTYGHTTASGSVEVIFTQERVSHHLGVSRQSVAKILREWRKRAWVETEYGRVVVRDMDALRLIAGLTRRGAPAGPGR